MHFVGAPQITVADPAKRAESPRNPLYQIRTSDEGDTMKAPSASSSDPMTYAPGELVTLHLRVTNRFTESRRAKDGIGGMFACWPGLGMLFHGFTQMCSDGSNVGAGVGPDGGPDGVGGVGVGGVGPGAPPQITTHEPSAAGCVGAVASLK